MDNKINQVKTNNVNFSGVKPKPAEVLNMEEKIKKIIENLLKRDREIAEYGDFAPISETFKNTEKELCASDFGIKIFQAPEGIEDRETQRAAQLVAYKYPTPFFAKKMLAFGTKNEILEKLSQKDLYKEIKQTFIEMSKALENP